MNSNTPDERTERFRTSLAYSIKILLYMEVVVLRVLSDLLVEKGFGPAKEIEKLADAFEDNELADRTTICFQTITQAGGGRIIFKTFLECHKEKYSMRAQPSSEKLEALQTIASSALQRIIPIDQALAAMHYIDFKQILPLCIPIAEAIEEFTEDQRVEPGGREFDKFFWKVLDVTIRRKTSDCVELFSRFMQITEASLCSILEKATKPKDYDQVLLMAQAREAVSQAIIYGLSNCNP